MDTIESRANIDVAAVQANMGEFFIHTQDDE